MPAGVANPEIQFYKFIQEHPDATIPDVAKHFKKSRSHVARVMYLLVRLRKLKVSGSVKENTTDPGPGRYQFRVVEERINYVN
mgnify:CR=1 FL=1